MSYITITPAASQHQLRAELESYVLGDQLGPAGGESEELPERTVRDRYLVSVLALSCSAGAAANGRPDSKLNHVIHETKQSVRFTISEAARREVLQRLLKLNPERCAERVKQGLHGKKKGAANITASTKNSKKKQTERPASLFDKETDE